MISREFIYEFSNFDDIYINFDDIPRRPHDIFTRENDKKSCAHDICTREMGVKCRQNQRSCIKQPLGLRAMGVRYRK